MDSILPNWNIVTGDCVLGLDTISNRSIDLVFADPPFNIGYDYDVYEDDMDIVEYQKWTHKWLSSCYRILKDTGSIYVAIGTRHQAMIRLEMDKIGFRWRSTLCWHYTFGPRQTKNWTPSWVAIHYATKGDSWTWNPEPIKVPSARQLKYKDRRAVFGGKIPDNVWVLHPDQYKGCFSTDEDTLLVSRVCGTFKERVDHPCQMPEALLERIIHASSNPGDLILDPFTGSGVTGVVAVKLNRKFLGYEKSEKYANIAKKRINNIRKKFP